MSVSNYSIEKCKYIRSQLKNVLYLVSEEHIKDVIIDNGEAYITDLTELPLKINGFNIQLNEETSLDERYRFQKTLTLSMHGYVNYKIFGGRYYAIVEDITGVYYMINVDFPSRITHTFNLSQNTNQTDFTFSSLSNFPTLKLNAEFEEVEPVCLGLNVYGIDKLQLIEKEKATIDTENRTVVSTEDFKNVEFLGKSCSFQEVYDGFKVTDTITFSLPLNQKIHWAWNLLEFLENRYSAIITPRGNDNKYYSGFNFGLQPSYTIQTASNAGESDIITITLTEASVYGSTAAVDWREEQSGATRWRYVMNVGSTICYECIGLGRARYLVKQEVDMFGSPTGNYQVMEGYESQYQNFHIVGTFTTEQVFNTNECTSGDTCTITTNMPSVINFGSVTCNTYTLKTSCDWSVTNLPSNITVNPTSGVASSSYTISVCNLSAATSNPIENSFNIKCCSTTRVVNCKVQQDAGCIRPLSQNINCLSQSVQFTYDGNCRINVTSIPSNLTYTIGNNTLTIQVPSNTSSSAITYPITITNCNCSSASTSLSIVQDKTYEKWITEGGYVCVSGNSYTVERKYTGTTLNGNYNRTDVTRAGSLIQSGDTRCSSGQTKWEWDNTNYYCIDGNKYKIIFEWASNDNGQTWSKTGKTRLGDLVELDSSWCNSGVTYEWRLTTEWVCGSVAPSTPQYRWVNLDPSTDYYCSGTTKYYKQQKQVSNDGGSTWQNVVPAEYQWGASAETESTDCGYVPTGYTTQYLTFVSQENGTFGFSGTSSSNTVQYSLDSGSTWTTLASGTSTPTVQSGETIMWKASLEPGYNGSGRFSSTGQFEVEGNIMSLLFDDNFIGQTSLSGYGWWPVLPYLFSGCTGVTSAENLVLPATTLAEYCYHRMFYGCTSLTSIPELPATTLTNYCYYRMFDGCTSLTTAPELPATTLADYCYCSMFQGCTGLTTVPSNYLPVTTLANGCYSSMFNGCTSLTSAPQLPSTTLKRACYSSMFYGCTSLTSAPQLPATTLEASCYAYMFQGCTSLTSAPILSATTLADSCYNYMFYGCSHLSSITCLATDISASICTDRWVQGVASSGTFKKNASMSSWTSGISGIPSNWTVQNYTS